MGEGPCLRLLAARLQRARGQGASRERRTLERHGRQAEFGSGGRGPARPSARYRRRQLRPTTWASAPPSTSTQGNGTVEGEGRGTSQSAGADWGVKGVEPPRASS